jgi:hypothetical protein
MTVVISSLLPAIAEKLDREEFAFHEMEERLGNVPGFLLFRDGRMHLVLVDHASADFSRQLRCLQKQFEPHFTHVITVLDGDPVEVDWGSLAGHFRTDVIEAPVKMPVRCDQWGHLHRTPR